MVKILKCSMFGEFIHLATRVANQSLTDQVGASFVQKYPIKMEQATKLLEDIATLEEKMVFMINSAHPEFDFFFQYAEGQHTSLAQSLLILFENKDELPTIDDSQWQLYFTFALSNFLSEDAGESGNKLEPLSKEELVRKLFRSDLSDTLKYRFMILMENPNRLIQHLFGMFQEIQDNWLKHQREFDALIRRQLQKYEQMSIDELIAYVERTINIRSIPRSEEILIAPGVFNYNALSFTEYPWYQSETTVMIWYLGIKLFDIFEIINSTADQKQRLATALKVLADQSKLEILILCKQDAQYGVNLAKKLKLSAATVSYHLNSLVNLGYLTMNMEGNRIYYRTYKDRIQSDLQAISELLD